MMKKLITIFCCSVAWLNFAINVNADERYAYEYSSDNDEDQHIRHHKGDDNWRESENYEQRYHLQPHYQQPIQIYMQPNQRFYSPDKQDREDNRWRQRREELQQMPQTPYFENQFNRDDTHW